MKLTLSASNLEELKVQVQDEIDWAKETGEDVDFPEEVKQVLNDAVWQSPFYVIEADTDIMEYIDEIRVQLNQ